MSGWRQQVQPDLAVVVDESMCILIEVGLGDSVRAVPLSDCDRVADAMELARVYVQASEDDWYSKCRLEAQARQDQTHTGMRAHGGYAPHSHEVRPDHDGVALER